MGRQNQGAKVLFSRHPVYFEVNTGVKDINFTFDSGVLVSRDVVAI